MKKLLPILVSLGLTAGVINSINLPSNAQVGTLNGTNLTLDADGAEAVPVCLTADGQNVLALTTLEQEQFDGIAILATEGQDEALFLEHPILYRQNEGNFTYFDIDPNNPDVALQIVDLDDLTMTATRVMHIPAGNLVFDDHGAIQLNPTMENTVPINQPAAPEADQPAPAAPAEENPVDLFLMHNADMIRPFEERMGMNAIEAIVARNLATARERNLNDEDILLAIQNELMQGQGRQMHLFPGRLAVLENPVHPNIIIVVDPQTGHGFIFNTETRMPLGLARLI